MKHNIKHIRKTIADYQLRVTPQRVAVLEALQNLRTHPTADEIIQFIRREYPNLSVGTVYNTLDKFCEKGIIKKVKTDKDVMRYDAFTDNHFHLYCEDSDRIEDYYDKDLTKIIENYFAQKKIDNFNIKDIQVQINGQFTDYHKKKK